MATLRFPVEATHILMFARAVGDEHPAFIDAGSPEAKELGGIVAPPTFATAGAQFDEDYPLRPKRGEPWFGSGREPSGEHRDMGGALHAEQRFEYHAPMRAGMLLTGKQRAGKTWEKRSRSGGTLRFAETIVEYSDAETGDLVVTSTTVRVLTERPPVEKGP